MFTAKSSQVNTIIMQSSVFGNNKAYAELDSHYCKLLCVSITIIIINKQSITGLIKSTKN